MGQKYHVLCVMTDGIINDMVRHYSCTRALFYFTTLLSEKSKEPFGIRIIAQTFLVLSDRVVSCHEVARECCRVCLNSRYKLFSLNTPKLHSSTVPLVAVSLLFFYYFHSLLLSTDAVLL